MRRHATDTVKVTEWKLKVLCASAMCLRITSRLSKSAYNHFDKIRNHINRAYFKQSRAAALTEWRSLVIS